MSDLPEGWAQVPIGTFARIVGGGTPPSKDPANFAPPGQGTPWITPADLSGYRAQTIERGARDLSPAGLAACGATLMPKGTVLFSSRAPIGYVAIAANEISTNQGFKSFILPEGFDPRFTYYQLKHLKPEAEAIATGTTFKELSGAATATLLFKVSPLNEQTRIADQLDKLLARVQACNDRIDAIPALLKRFRQAVLDAATLGELTSDWREANCLPFQWEKVCLKDIADVKGGVTKDSKKQSASDEEVPYLRVANVQRGHIDLREIKTIRVPRVKLEELLLESGDVLFNEGGDLDKLGRGWIWEGQISRCTFQNHVFRARLYDPSNQPKFVSWWGNSRGLEYFLRAGKQTTNLASINKTMLAALPISLPPAEEQAEIVRRVEALFKLADRIEARYMTARAQTQRLTPLLLAKAFRGELVQQDSQDESASVLLERIAATKPAKPRTSRERPRVQKRPPAVPELDPIDWASLPNGAWAAPADPNGQAAMVWLTAVLRAWGEPMPEREARLAVVLCQQPRLFAAVLPAAQATQWSRLVGDEARPLPAQMRSFQPAVNGQWARAIKGMRARDDLVEAGLGDGITWALGAGAASIETAGWPDGRAGFVVAYLRAHGIASVLPLLEPSAQEFVDVRAA